MAFDYAFLSREGDERPLTILVTKDRDSRIIMGNVVLHKGRGEEDSIVQRAEKVKRLGHHGKVLIKTDNEPALISLRDGRRRPFPRVPQSKNRPAGLLEWPASRSCLPSLSSLIAGWPPGRIGRSKD